MDAAAHYRARQQLRHRFYGQRHIADRGSDVQQHDHNDCKYHSTCRHTAGISRKSGCQTDDHRERQLPVPAIDEPVQPGLAHFQRAGNKAHILFGIAFVSGEEPDPVREEQQYAHQAQRLHQRHDGGIAAKIDAQHGDVSHTAGHRAEQRRDIVNARNLMHHDARDECVGREHEHQQEERLE